MPIVGGKFRSRPMSLARSLMVRACRSEVVADAVGAESAFRLRLGSNEKQRKAFFYPATAFSTLLRSFRGCAIATRFSHRAGGLGPPS